MKRNLKSQKSRSLNPTNLKMSLNQKMNRSQKMNLNQKMSLNQMNRSLNLRNQKMNHY